jgi:rod shape determining protein RodA
MRPLVLIQRYDWWLGIAVAFLATASLLTLRSAKPELFWPQVVWFAAGLLIIFFVSRFDIRPLSNYRWIVFTFYALALLLLVAVLIFGPVIREAKSWIVLGPLRFQPAEFAKVALIVMLAYFLAHKHRGIKHAKTVLTTMLFAALPVGLIFLEPDWGSALVVISVWVGFLVSSGLRTKHIIIGIAAVLILSALSWNFFLKDYQRERIVGFFEPTYDPLGINYSVIQAKIAIGSAGMWGKGFGQGTQTQLGFLTEPGTDFSFAAFTEEWGIFGGVLLLGAFFTLVVRVTLTGMRAGDAFSQFICLGTAILFLVEFFLNIGSNLGLLPVVGVTFPLFSYGGSSLLTKAFLIGIIQGVAVRNSF